MRVLRLGEPDYPSLLAPLYDPPERLFVIGELGKLGGIAIVGARRASSYGLRVARSFGAQAAAGTAVVSGLARGVDAAAHLGALEAGGPTWAVLGGGLDRIYPPENAPLARRIVESGGCLISEYPPGTAPLPHHFRARNRIIAGLSFVTVVVEGTSNSGALITAKEAVDLGRSVYAVPGDIEAKLSAAPHKLLRDGASPIVSMADVWHELPLECRPLKEAALRGSPRRPLAASSEKILQSMGSEAVTMEELARRSGLDIPGLSNIILDMEFEDLIVALPGPRYAKKRI